MTRSQSEIGQGWENVAARHLESAGLQILARHYYCRLGEIDLIAADGDTIVFVEVRYRARSAHGGAAASVTRSKQQRIVRTARHFIMRNHELARHPMRMDVVAIDGGGSVSAAAARVHWIRGAFDAE